MKNIKFLIFNLILLINSQYCGLLGYIKNIFNIRLGNKKNLNIDIDYEIFNKKLIEENIFWNNLKKNSSKNLFSFEQLDKKLEDELKKRKFYKIKENKYQEKILNKKFKEIIKKELIAKLMVNQILIKNKVLDSKFINNSNPFKKEFEIISIVEDKIFTDLISYKA